MQGYGTFVVADGATQTLSKLNETNKAFHGTLKATGGNSVLTLNSALAGDASLLATDGGKVELGTAVNSLGTLTVESTGASKANVNMMTDGEAQMAILQSDVLNYAHEGTFTFAETGAETSALWVMGIYNETVQILAKPGIKTVADLKGKTICVGDVGSGTEVNAWQVLGAVGLTKDDVNAVNGSFQDGVDQLKDGKIDAAFLCAGAPTPAVTELAASKREGRPLTDKWTFSTNGVSIQGRYGIPCVGFGPGAESQAHAPNEVTFKQDLVTCAALYAAVPMLYHPENKDGSATAFRQELTGNKIR